jgi:Tol biopolymer transport system component/tRNA A-37 threonylcarbamoyl transferase component Bud32
MAMNPERLRQIEELYHLAGERPPGERETFLTEACGNDADLKRQVLALLAQDSAAGPMERPVLEVAAGLLADSSSAQWTAGTQVGPYQIVSLLGEGGMGAVFKARDTRLGREVAIKTAHEEFSGRFQREARAISSLNHTNICTLYDVGPNYLVMELVEGANLAGPVPIETAIGYARQIAAGLEAAHEKGIIHRDLKPANIKVTRDGVVKILDFGLAKATQVPATESATVSMTEQGLILGTAAYMSPEQARGEVVDKRADIWAFGVVLYELLTGKMLFGESKNVSDVLAAVLTREPDFATLPKGTPPRVRRLLELCLRKDPKQRLRDIGDVRIRLDEAEPESPAQRAPARRWPWAAGLAVVAVVVAFAWYHWQANHSAGPFQHIQITRLTDSGKATAAAISPDGKYVVHAVTDEGKSSLWLLNAATGSNVQILPPAQGGFYNLNFSRDSNSLYYVFDTGTGVPAMYTMPVLGGNARTVAAFPGLTVAAISPDEKRIAFPRAVREDRGLFIANLDGSGERQLAARKAPDQFHAPAWSPDGKTIAYSVHSSSGPSAVLAATPVEGGPERRISSRLHGGVWALRWMPGGNGLIATANPQYPFLQLWYFTYPGGQAQSITNDLNSYSGLSLTGDGSALVTVQNETVSHLWVVTPSDLRSAREISTGRSDGLNFVAFAGNGNLYFEAPDSSGATQIWSTGPEGAGRRQITTGESNSGLPAPCGDRHLVFFSFRAGAPHIFLSDLDGGNVRQLTNRGEEFQPSCSPDGTWLTYVSRDSKSLGVWRIPPEGGSPVRIWDRPVYSEISPDGRSVLVTGANGKVTILPAGGGQPIRSFEKVPWLGYWAIVHWSADGTALLYGKTVGGVTNIWQRPLNGDAPQQLTAFTTERITAFAVSRDGKKLALARGTTSSDVVLIRDLK